jgi:hypothetical protein
VYELVLRVQKQFENAGISDHFARLQKIHSVQDTRHIAATIFRKVARTVEDVNRTSARGNTVAISFVLIPGLHMCMRQRSI